ncbi:MAG: ankyrin repeat domain-containing protein [Bdellovibrionota bacterium]
MSAGDWKEMYNAAATGDLALVQYHITGGVNPNYQHPEILCTPLVAAIVAGHTAIAKFLLEHGADPTLLSEYDNLTPLQAAQLHGRQEILQILNQRRPPQSYLAKIWRKLRFLT